MTILSHKHLHGREFGSSLLGVTEFFEWLALNKLRIATAPDLHDYDFVQVEALLCAVEGAAGSISEDEARGIIAADQLLTADRMADDAPRWLVGAEAHRKWREIITRAVMDGHLQLLDFGSKLPTTIPTAAKMEGEARGWIDAGARVTAVVQEAFRPNHEPASSPDLVSTDPGPTQSIQHKIRDRVPSILTAEIAEAKRNAPDPSLPASVWDELTKLAARKFGVLVGVASEGIQYRGKLFLDVGEFDIFKRRNLTDRMRHSGRDA
jgi:hypothetical protein